MTESPLVMWEPSSERVAASNLNRYMAGLRAQGVDVSNYDSLYRWSVTAPDAFWPSAAEFCDIRFSKACKQVVRDVKKMPGAVWFEGAELNFAEHLLRFDDDRTALVFRNEAGDRRTLTYADLHRQVTPIAAAMRSMGIVAGDRVVAYLPNIPEAVVCMLAATSLGAVWSSCSPDFGAGAVVDRFAQVEPRLLVAADGACYNGKKLDRRFVVEEVLQELPSVEHLLTISYAMAETDWKTALPVSRFEKLLEQPAEPISYIQLPFDHPLYVLFSSGTTGVPKCIVHGAGGTLLQHQKEQVLHTDLTRKDVIFYYTTTGWMMWNWLVSTLAVGCTLVLYDGSPFAKEGNITFDLADEEQITVFGTSAKFLSACDKAGLVPLATHDLSSVKTILSTGSPLLPEGFDYVYGKVKKDVCLSSISGGTDIISCFIAGDPTGPVCRGELQVPGLAMDVHVFNDKGEAVVGEKGELVCTTSFPSMPIGFWGDEDGSRYHNAYFDVYPNVWRHGDYIEQTERGSFVVFGRSDTLLNPGGVRIGTAEIYRQVEKHPDVMESIVVGQERGGDMRVILFVVLTDGTSLTEELQAQLRKLIRDGASPRHVPAVIVQVRDIPRTISGKIAEMAVRDTIHSREVKNTDALANPEALAEYRGRVELEA